MSSPVAACEPKPLRRSDVVALLGVVALVALLWGRGRHTWFWTDEGLSLGIASHPVADLAHLARQDTAPPLYHVLLHGWMRLFGSSEGATHVLSLLFALAVVPAAFWAGWTLFDRRTAWMCALLASVSPFLATYANETRMYSLVTLLSVLVTGTFLNAFVLRRRRYLVPFVVFLTASLYTHYWALFLAAGCATAAVGLLLWASDRRRLLFDLGLAFGIVAVLFAPWVPTLLYQRAHSAVQWALPPTLRLARDDVLGLFGGPTAALALAVGGGAAFVLLFRPPWTRAAVVAAAAVAIAVVVVGTGWIASRASSQWHARYLGVALAPMLLVLGLGLARGGPIAVAALVTVAILVGPIDTAVPLDKKSNTKALVEQASPLLRPGDLVFSPIGEVPLLAHYLPPGLRYATTTGSVKDPLLADWRDAMQRLRATGPATTLPPLLDQVPLGGHVLIFCPRVDEPGLVGLPPYIELEIRRCLEAKRLATDDPTLGGGRLLRSPPNGGPEDAELLTKVSTPA